MSEPEIYQRIMRYAGKRRNQVTSPRVTANEAISYEDALAVAVPQFGTDRVISVKEK